LCVEAETFCAVLNIIYSGVSQSGDIFLRLSQNFFCAVLNIIYSGVSQSGDIFLRLPQCSDTVRVRELLNNAGTLTTASVTFCG